MDYQTIKERILVPTVATALAVTAKVAPTKEELITCTKVTSGVAAVTAIACLAILNIRRNLK